MHFQTVFMDLILYYHTITSATRQRVIMPTTATRWMRMRRMAPNFALRAARSANKFALSRRPPQAKRGPLVVQILI